MPAPLKILVLYDDWAAETGAVYDLLRAYKEHSVHQICYAIGTREGAGPKDVAAVRQLADCFDVIIVSHSVRVYVTHYINPMWAEVLATYQGYKVLFVQDDYERTETTRQWIEKLGINALFTVVPEAYWEQVYPRQRFPNVEIQQVLTGYVPNWALTRGKLKPLAARSRFIGYRAFKLPYYFGELGREKFMIGFKMRQICEERGIPVDIEWAPEKRIYGEAWHDFVEDCRATLGTESGSNIFDEHGEIERQVSEAVKNEPEITYEEIFERYLRQHEGRVKMNQISPRIFEAIALGSALVLYDGEYSGVIRPGEHFIPLSKDFSNVDEVLEKLRDLDALEEMTRRAFADVVESGRYSYGAFIRRIDEFLRERVTPKPDGVEAFWLSSGSLPLPEPPSRLTFTERHAWATSEPFGSTAKCLDFFSKQGSQFSDEEISVATERINRAESEEARLTKDFTFLQTEVARLTQKNADLRDAQKKQADRSAASAKCAAILMALADSRWIAWLRALGLCKAAPRLKGAKPEEDLKELVAYVASDRRLSRAASKDGRLRKALEAAKDK